MIVLDHVLYTIHGAHEVLKKPCGFCVSETGFHTREQGL